MIENITGTALLALGVQIPLVIGVTAWLAKRAGIRINWFRVAVISVVIGFILATSLLLVASSRFGNQDTITLTLFGTVAICLGLTWLMTRKARRRKPNLTSEDIAANRVESSR
jgi:Ca2+/Na+ antiporter